MPMEAMACGTACVTTNVGAAFDYAINGKTVLYCKTMSAKDIFLKTDLLIQNKKLRATIANNAKKHIRSFTWEKTTNNFIKALGIKPL